MTEYNLHTKVDSENGSCVSAKTVLSEGWISVKERLPPAVTPVLVFGWCCDICHNIRIAEYEVDGWYESFYGNDLTFEPEYWMPLPLPPACH